MHRGLFCAESARNRGNLRKKRYNRIKHNIYLSDIINKAPTFTTKPQSYVRGHKIGGGKR